MIIELLCVSTLLVLGLPFGCVSQDVSEFINIDCGATKTSHIGDLVYSTDDGFIDSGENHEISASYSANVAVQMQTLRSFPVGTRNCYNLSVEARKKHMIKAHFLYGNYDGKNVIPKFDLYLGVERWDTVTRNGFAEIIYAPTSNYIHVCLVNIFSGIPYISALELRPLNPEAYLTAPQLALVVSQRINFAPLSNETIGYPDDVYGREWSPPQDTLTTGLKPIRTTSSIDNSGIHELPPPIVLQTGVTSEVDLIEQIYTLDPNRRLYFCLYFCEVRQLNGSDVTEFEILLNGDKLNPPANLTLGYLDVESWKVDGQDIRSNFGFQLRPSARSFYPPLLNALELFGVLEYLQSQTNQDDVLAMGNLKAAYGLKKSSWQGDPCLPRDFLWEGLDCITDDHDPSVAPTIKYLDLSSSGLSGYVNLDLSKLQSLQFLDLSHNSLTGQIPDFLAEMPSLKVLNLTGNNFSGPVPQILIDKEKKGLILRIDDVQKQETKKKGKLVMVVALSLAVLLIIVVIILFAYRKLIKSREGKLGGRSSRRQEVVLGKSTSAEKSKSSSRETSIRVRVGGLAQFKYPEIIKMTDDFQKPIGGGGFGQVSHGSMPNGTEVAVKLLSLTSKQGPAQFETEIKLLERASHPNLTPILGYCEEGQKMAIVYKYMPNGSLKDCLTTDRQITWSQRLKIALGAAQGLLYLHEKHNHVHRDVKTSNILLDENLEAKLSDYGLARRISEDETHTTTLYQGSGVYGDPEYRKTLFLRRESDVYSFGVVLVQVLTGKQSRIEMETYELVSIVDWFHEKSQLNVDLLQYIDAKLNGNFDKESAEKAFKLAITCVSKTAAGRPTMRKIVKELKSCFEEAKANEQVRMLQQSNS